MNKSLVIIPTYNEKENIEAIIAAVLTLDTSETSLFHVLIVDDGSPDGTGILVKEQMRNYPSKLHLIERRGKMGLGTAYIAGFKWALARDYDFICEMDADFSHDPQDLNRLQNACHKKNADVAIGSRYVKGGKSVNWTIDRRILSYGASLYVRAVTGMRIKDSTAGFICYRRRVLQDLNLDEIQFTGYAFQIEMKYAALKLGYKLIELPITFKDRVVGVSKMSKNIIQEAVWGVLQLRWKYKQSSVNQSRPSELIVNRKLAD